MIFTKINEILTLALWICFSKTGILETCLCLRPCFVNPAHVGQNLQRRQIRREEPLRPPGQIEQVKATVPLERKVIKKDPLRPETAQERLTLPG